MVIHVSLSLLMQKLCNDRPYAFTCNSVNEFVVAMSFVVVMNVLLRWTMFSKEVKHR